MLERRHYVRANAQIEASVTPVDQEQTEVESRVVDISIGGMMLALGQEYPPGTQLTITLALPGHDGPVQCRGRVVWHDRDRLSGVEIVEIDPKDRERIDQLIVEACRRQAEEDIVVL
jgi:Predicted glycosyltransferase